VANASVMLQNVVSGTVHERHNRSLVNVDYENII
jgi:hypothetical protein